MPNTFTDPEAHELAEQIRAVKDAFIHYYKELEARVEELADAINVVQDRIDAVITQHRVLEERVATLEALESHIHDLETFIDKQDERVLDLEVAWEDLVDLQKRWNRMEERVARLEDYFEQIMDVLGMARPEPEPPDASWRD